MYIVQVSTSLTDVLSSLNNNEFQSSNVEMKPHLFLISIFCFSLASGETGDQFDEELFIKPLSTGHVNTYFQFTTEWLLQNNESRKNFNSTMYDFDRLRKIHFVFFQFITHIWWHVRWRKYFKNML